MDKNPKRVAAGKLNRAKRKPLNNTTRDRLSQAAYRNRPWDNSTGPRTKVGKARASQNAKKVTAKRSTELDIMQAAATMLSRLQELRRAHYVDADNIVIRSAREVADRVRVEMQVTNEAASRRLSNQLMDDLPICMEGDDRSDSSQPS